MLNKSLILAVVASFLLSIYLYFCLENKKKIIEDTKKQLTIKTYENSICSANLDKQNKAIESLRAEVKIGEAEKEKIEVIKTIKVKDETCEAKLFAYERLFDSSF
ncbi:MAG: hypothetical protein ACOCMY_00145 [Campylobacter hyointestinalis]